MARRPARAPTSVRGYFWRIDVGFATAKSRTIEISGPTAPASAILDLFTGTYLSDDELRRVRFISIVHKEPLP